MQTVFKLWFSYWGKIQIWLPKLLQNLWFRNPIHRFSSAGKVARSGKRWINVNWPAVASKGIWSGYQRFKPEGELHLRMELWLAGGEKRAMLIKPLDWGGSTQGWQSSAGEAGGEWGLGAEQRARAPAERMGDGGPSALWLIYWFVCIWLVEYQSKSRWTAFPNFYEYVEYVLPFMRLLRTDTGFYYH